jgi:hypothetical protein
MFSQRQYISKHTDVHRLNPAVRSAALKTISTSAGRPPWDHV